MKVEEFFIDGLGKLSYNSGIFRIEFTTLESIPDTGKSATYVPSHRLVMSVDTLMKFQASLDRVVDELRGKGLVAAKNL
jgi:hypothetical protein